MTTALIITTAGINCDRELGEAFERAGATAQFRHLNDLMADPSLIDRADLIGLPGGFSYGDAVAAGRIVAQLVRNTIYPQLVHAIERGVPMIAPCNGFQIAVQVGLLPGPEPGAAWAAEPPAPTVTLARNESARFVDRWTRVEVPADTRCVWTRGLDVSAETSLLPIAHGEGRFVPESDAVLERLAEGGRIAVRYAPDDNPNGSIGAVAGICDASGLVFGLMPHPERYTRWTQHPWWNRLAAADRTGEPPGLQMFRNAVRHAQQVAVG
ncbi:MAG: phosphoribosylformylglycinamidine synthase subunit PurQ [Planctomycetota bacterium]|jgi:phosphoribosylformylglycinamidine synthase